MDWPAGNAALPVQSIAEGRAPLPVNQIGNLDPMSPDDWDQEGNRKDEEQKVQIDLAGDQHGNDQEFPGQMQPLPSVARHRYGGLQPAAPAVRPLEPRVAEDDASGAGMPNIR